MLSLLYDLSVQTDGRYATDSELEVVKEYLESYSLRLSAYRKLQLAEARIVEQVQARIKRVNPGALAYDDANISQLCERDMLYVLRYSAITLLINDTNLLEERVIIWLQTIMRSFKHHLKRCDVTYRVLQEVVQQHLTPAEAALFCPIIELNRQFLGFS
jgi:hypothetical protein